MIKKILTTLILSFLSVQSMAQIEEATLAGGCFWCTEADMEKFLKDDVISGYSGGSAPNPSYKEVSSGNTKYIESIQLNYDTEKYTYIDVLDNFIRHIDPTDGTGSFFDRGYQYSPAIFYHNEKQKIQATDFINEINKSKIFKEKLNVKILKYDTFYDAEEVHQNYYLKNKIRYYIYRFKSGRDYYIKSIFGDNEKTIQDIIDYKIVEEIKEKEYVKPSDQVIRSKLTPIQYQVTQQDATERAFSNQYWDNNLEGIYVDIVSGEPLFSSKDKYKSGTGWPSFSKPINEKFIVQKLDFGFYYPKMEVRSKFGDSHLGHVFKDGPAPDFLRYCMNSASMRFIPKDDLEKEGYSEFLKDF